MPFGALYALELSKRYGDDLTQYEKGLDRMLMFLGRYGHQSAVELENTPTVTLVGWVEQLKAILEDEERKTKVK